MEKLELLSQMTDKTFLKEALVFMEKDSFYVEIDDKCIYVTDEISIFDDPLPTDFPIKKFSMDYGAEALDYFYELVGEVK